MQASREAVLVKGNLQDLEAVYQLLIKQFPPEEIYKLEHMQQLMQNNQYVLLLYRREEDGAIVGYVTVYSAPDCDIVWLDLLAIAPQFQSQGYGRQMFQAVYQKYCGPYSGVLLCAEKVCKENPEQARVQQRRLDFYESLGMYPLHTEFELPIPSGGLPMVLLYKPRKQVTSLSRVTQLHLLTEMFDYCYHHIKHRGKLLAQAKGTIVDEHFHEG